MVSGEQFLVKAPNGAVYRLHSTGAHRGYVYALGHRVYGHVGGAVLHNGSYFNAKAFIPTGKWAFIVADVPALYRQHTEGAGV